MTWDIIGFLPTWHGPDFTCNFPQTILRPMSLRFTPKHLPCFDSHFLVNTSRCSIQQLSVISNKYCLCLQLELRPTVTLVRPKNPSFMGLKTQVFPHHSLKIASWVSIECPRLGRMEKKSDGKNLPVWPMVVG